VQHGAPLVLRTDLIEWNLVAAPIVQPGRPRDLVVCHFAARFL